MAATTVAASLSVAQALGKPLCVGNASSLRASPQGATRSACRMAVRASAQKQPAKEWAAAAAVAAVLVLPEVAEAAQPALSPSLKNFLLSIVSGGVVLVAIVGAVVAVSNFDPVKRG
ncbi:uncharacterized protein LOC133912487 [Phragmites australis]|uniref:uncharacterized protein LOC133912487 n=1 Tax=Phragmites australis TaxID=29695 RepID=UPI002D78C91C|nr:uncharacterized protein LOC133912487 [Phragmites australis]